MGVTERTRDAPKKKKRTLSVRAYYAVLCEGIEPSAGRLRGEHFIATTHTHTLSKPWIGYAEELKLLQAGLGRLAALTWNKVYSHGFYIPNCQHAASGRSPA